MAANNEACEKMAANHQEEYHTLDWIIEESESGIYLVAAEPSIQKEIAEKYRRSSVGIYDYEQNPGSFRFQKLQSWIDSLPKAQTFLMVNFQFAIQEEEDLKRLNFSRDMLAGLKKNLIFLVNSYGDEKLSAEAVDFYSFVKLRVLFQTEEYINQNAEIIRRLEEEGDMLARDFAKRWEPEKAREKLDEANNLKKRAEEEKEKGNYWQGARMLMYSVKILESLVGENHLEIAVCYLEMAEIFRILTMYQEAEGAYRKALSIRELAEAEHPDTAACYRGLALLYETQGKYAEAEKAYRKAQKIYQETMGENHPDAIAVMKNLEHLQRKRGIKK
ncbi:MAG: tetratricopeptide repeat protein [Lachnospiraceae bacterium]|nr:tetratricopeptide repeat protein [Lachnospiraceae bacterium]